MKIDNMFTDVIAITLKAQYAKREEKLGLLIEMTQKLDTVKYFVTILWETKGLDSSKYTQLAQKLSSAGTMLGGWIKKLQPPQNETPPT
jgi:hypothetical protein